MVCWPYSGGFQFADCLNFSFLEKAIYAHEAALLG
jgi:hypothetical protein